MSEWISTAEKWPDDDEAVLVATDDGEVWIGYTDAGEWFYSDGGTVCHYVIHWMGFPVHPKTVGRKAAL